MSKLGERKKSKILIVTLKMSPLRQRAGVILYAFSSSDDLCFLLGKEKFDGYWSPLAGTVEVGESLVEAACREFVEESMGLFSYEEILFQVETTSTIITIVDDAAISSYYLIPSQWEPNIPFYFDNVTKFFLRCTGNQVNQWGIPILSSVCRDGLFEKTALAWWSSCYLKTMLASPEICHRWMGPYGFKLIASLLDTIKVKAI